MIDYKSPINVFQTQIELIEMEIENEIFKAVHKVGVTVDKEELLKALKYDREQYEKGYYAGCNANKWIPCSERLPEEEGSYLTTTEHGGVRENHFYIETGLWGYRTNKTIAWQPKPEPYKGGIDND